MFKQKKAGALMVILKVLFIVFIVGMVWMIYDKPFSDMGDKITPDLTGDSLTTFNKIMSVWNNWPIYTIITALLAGIGVIIWKSQGGNNSVPPPPGYY